MFHTLCCDPLVSCARSVQQVLSSVWKDMKEGRIERKISEYIAYSKATFVETSLFLFRVFWVHCPVQFSCSVVSNSLQPDGLQHTRPPCPSPTPGVDTNKSIQSVMPSNHLILCSPLLLLPSIFPSIRVSSNESALRIRRPKYWSFSFSSTPSNEYSGLISFKMDWFDLLAVQGTLKSLLQHHSSKASILWHSTFFRVQLFTSIHDY